MMGQLQQQVGDSTKVWIAAALCISTLSILYCYYNNYYNYWASRGIKGGRPFFIFSQLYALFFEDRIKAIPKATKKYGKIWGTFDFGRPRLVVADAEVVRQIAIRDFDSFRNHNLNPWANKYHENFLVWIKDDHWKHVRALMTPSFTSGKIKRMYKLLDGCSEDLIDNFKEQYLDARRAGQEVAKVDLSRTYSMYTMDGITTCCYGLKLKRERGAVDIKAASSRNSLIKDCGKVFRFKISSILKMLFLPKLVLRAMHFKLVPEADVDGLIKRVERLVEQRRQSGQKNRYDDLLQMLVDAKIDDKLELNEMDQAENHHAGLTEKTIREDHNRLAEGQKRQSARLNDLELLSNLVLLLAAGLDTTRSSLSTITYLLANNRDIQQRLYEEISKIAKYEPTAMGKRLTFDYEDLTACQYLDAVISESLRMLTPALYTDRCANNDYYIEKYGIKIARGSMVLLGFHSLHHDPDYWSEPEKFDPERFMPGQREKIVPGSYCPFSMGPRHCLGMRFSLTETKLALAKVVMHFEFTPAPGTKYPPESKFGLSVVEIKNCLANVTLREME